MPGHWKHEWIPLDFEAARSKNHGRDPKNWHAPGGVEVRHHHEGTPGDHRDASWIKLANWHDSTDMQTGRRHADLGKVADFSGTVREGHRSGTAWNSGAKEYNWRVFRQRTEREGPDKRGSHWSGDYATGTEPTMAKAKSSAQAAMKKHRAQHIASGGDVGYGEPLPRGAVRAGGMVTNPKGTERLHEYWVHGEGAAKIRWGEPGDFDRCVLHLGKFISDPQGYCNLAHHAALGIYPATHAAMEKHTGRAAMADKKPYGDVTYADPKNGKYPIDTHDHAKAAWSYINMPKNAAMYPMNGVTLSEVKDRIKAACRKFGIDISEDEPAASGRAESLAPYYRSVPLEDISVRSGSGRDVEAYAAVFGIPAEVHDQDGDYTEELDPACFNRAISDAAPQGGRKDWRMGVFYHHGMTLYGTPSERHSMPIGKTLDMRADSRGLWTLTRYNRTPLADEVLENIREGSITGYSFSGHFRRSQPLIPRGGFRKNYRTGELPHVRRTESTLNEYGPTPRPVYAEAAVTGMRAEQMFAAMASDPELTMRMLSMFSASAHPGGDSLPDTGAPHQGDSPAEDSHLLVRSGRSVKEEIAAARSAFLQRYRR